MNNCAHAAIERVVCCDGIDQFRSGGRTATVLAPNAPNPDSELDRWVILLRVFRHWPLMRRVATSAQDAERDAIYALGELSRMGCQRCNALAKRRARRQHARNKAAKASKP